ncbi:unnamed protein product [Schistocephalus solidus]|uniref:Uncharacterized protein n=1 Tax=Schistocephalus solidus TaxID=70667 RepID=A0A183TQY3_SCHSO|nr:unnamed protein product [Schistocephalus solidus]
MFTSVGDDEHHRKEAVESEPGFAFLKPLVANIPPLKPLSETGEGKSRGRSFSVDSKISKKRTNDLDVRNPNGTSKSRGSSAAGRRPSRKRLRAEVPEDLQSTETEQSNSNPLSPNEAPGLPNKLNGYGRAGTADNSASIRDTETSSSLAYE